MASAVAKPDGMLVVEPEGELDFLHPLTVERLWGVGRVTAAKLHDRSIHTVGEVARLPESVLISMLGRASGRHIHALAHNRDPRPVQTGRRRRSIGAQRALGSRTVRTPQEIDAIVIGLVDRITRRMRDAGRAGRTVVLRMRFADFSRATRSHSMARATAHTHTILDVARTLLVAALPMIEEKGLTLVGISVGNLDGDQAIQLALPFDHHSDVMLDAALDAVRVRFGSNALKRAVLLRQDLDLQMPMLPD